MSSFILAATAILAMSIGVAIGVYLHRRLPDEHLSEETKDIVKLATGILATIAGLVLSLLITTAKSSYDAVAQDVKSAAADFIILDRTLANMGPETLQARQWLRQTLDIAENSDLSKAMTLSVDKDPFAQAAAYTDKMNRFMRELTLAKPSDEWLRERVLSLLTDLSHVRWMLQQEETNVLPGPFVAVVVIWLGIIFAGFGLFAPSNPTAIGALLLGAISISASLFLIDELNTPFHGVVHISTLPFKEASRLIGPLP